MRAYTGTYWDATFTMRAYNQNRSKWSDKTIRVTVCNKVIDRVLGSDPDYTYYINQYGTWSGPDVRTWFTNMGQNCENPSI